MSLINVRPKGIFLLCLPGVIVVLIRRRTHRNLGLIHLRRLSCEQHELGLLSVTSAPSPLSRVAKDLAGSCIHSGLLRSVFARESRDTLTAVTFHKHRSSRMFMLVRSWHERRRATTSKLHARQVEVRDPETGFMNRPARIISTRVNNMKLTPFASIE